MRQKPGPWAPAAHEAAPCPSQWLFVGMPEGSGLNQQVSGHEVAPLYDGGASGVATQREQQRKGLLRERLQPVRAPPQWDMQGLRASRVSRRSAAKAGRRDRAAARSPRNPLAAQAATACHDRGAGSGWGGSVSLGVGGGGFTGAGVLAGGWPELGPWAGPQGTRRTPRSTALVQGCGRGRGGWPAAGLGGARVCAEGSRMALPVCTSASIAGEVGGPRGGARGGAWGGGAAPCRELGEPPFRLLPDLRFPLKEAV